jgi:hypothetical protein
MLWLSLSHPPSHLRAASHSLPRSPHLASLDQVVFKQSVQLRRSVQSARGRPLPGPGAASGTLDDATLRRLQHAFVALAGGVATTAQVRVCVCVCVWARLCTLHTPSERRCVWTARTRGGPCLQTTPVRPVFQRGGEECDRGSLTGEEERGNERR